MNEMLRDPIVSVVITCYNQACFLGEAIESVLAQSCQHFEIVVVDDGSKDNTPEVASAYPQVRYIRQNNQGVSVARNVGLRQAKGRYLIFLDGDDRLLPDALKIGTDSLDEHPECAFVTGYCRFIAPDGSPLPALHQQYVEKPDYSTLLRDNHIWMPAMVMHRRESLAALGGLDIAADHSGDYELYLRIARNYPIYCHRQTIAEWRLHSTNTSHNTALMLKATLRVFRSQWDYVRHNKQYTEAYKSGLAYWKNLYGSQLIKKVGERARSGREWRQAAQDLLVLLRYCPRVFAKRLSRKIYFTISGVKI
jgi:glycosyltransferase involved in cell wall biosynthesis